MKQKLLFAAAAFAALCGLAQAQEWPVKPVRLIVTAPPGSGPDIDIRPVAARLGPMIGQSVVVENRPGAGARIAFELVAKSPPDGYTLLVGTPGLAQQQYLYAKLPYDVERDFVPVSLTSTTAYALTVNADVKARTLKEYIDLVKSGQPVNNLGTYGVGTTLHLSGGWFGQMIGSEFRFVHYNTSPPFGDLVSGQINAIFDAVLPVLGHAKAGRLRILAISGKARNPLLPDVPTFAEAGLPGFDPVVFIGVLAPAGTPRPVIDKLSAALAQIAKVPEIVAQRREGASESVGSTPEEFATFIDGERKKWGKVITGLGIRLE